MNSNIDNVVLPDLSYKLMSVLFDVHNNLGSTLLEKHYQKAIKLEFRDRKIKYDREKMINIEYKGEKVGKYFLDFVVENRIVLEIKASVLFGQSAYKQAYSYLKQLHLPLAIVVNFHDSKLKYKRNVNPEFENIRFD